LPSAARLNPSLVRLQHWFEAELTRVGVSVLTGIADGFQHPAAHAADHVIDATTPRAEPIEGARDACAPDALLPRPGPVSILGANMTGLNLAKSVAAQHGAEVTVFDSAPKAGRGLALVRRWRTLSELQDLGVKFQLGLPEADVVAAARANSDKVIDAAAAGDRTLLDAFADAARIADEFCEREAP